MRPRRSRAREYMAFSKSERNGILVLVVLIILLLLFPLFSRLIVRPVPSKNSNFYLQADSFFASLTSRPEESGKAITNIIEHEELNIHRNPIYFTFDPNTTTIEEFVQLGLSVKQAQVIERYRKKGGKFKTPEEFSKMYVIDSNTFRKLKPWIQINVLANNSKPSFKDSIPKLNEQPVVVELNTADTLELTKIKGIGKIFARRIVAYRNVLGGFVSVTQLSEVYGIKKELVTSIASSFTLDTSKIKLINLNLVSFEELKKHPYITDYQAKAIIYYRSKVGNIRNRKELLENKLLPLDKYICIKRYLTTN